MPELSAGLLFLLSLWVFGRTLIVICRIEDCDWAAMPTGLCLVGLIGNVLYFMCGLTVQWIQLLFLGALVPCLVIVFRHSVGLCEWKRVLATLGVFLFLALPVFIGGEQYYVFRGNDDDHFNYMDQGLAIWTHPYSVYPKALISGRPYSLHEELLAARKFMSNDVLMHGVSYFDMRPAVGLVFGLFLPGGWGNIHLLASLYVTGLWALFFPAACFAWKRLLEACKSDKTGGLFFTGPPFAYVVGFWGQSAFDFNSWSEMAALSLLLAFVFQYLRLLQKLTAPSRYESKTLLSQYITTGVSGGGGFLFYPEATMMNVALILMATVLWYIVTRNVLRLSHVVSLAVFAAIVLLASALPDYHTTARFLRAAIFCAASHWPHWRYLNTYWLGIHDNTFIRHIHGAIVHGLEVLKGYHKYRLGIPPANVFFHDAVGGLKLLKSSNGYWSGLHVPPVVGYITSFANLILACIGMFFVTPDYSVPFLIRYGWIVFTVILAGMAVYSIAAIAGGLSRTNQTALFLKSFFISGILFILILFYRGALWTVAMALSYFSPYLFLVFCLGLVERHNQIIKVFVVVLIVSQISFGAYRLWAARDPNGIGYDNATYPSIFNKTMKTQYIWNMDINAYAPCKGVRLYDVDNGNYMEYMKQKFTYFKIPYFSSLPVKSHFEVEGEGIIKLGQEPPMITDCEMGITMVGDKWETIKL